MIHILGPEWEGGQWIFFKKFKKLDKDIVEDNKTELDKEGEIWLNELPVLLVHLVLKVQFEFQILEIKTYYLKKMKIKYKMNALQIQKL